MARNGSTGLYSRVSGPYSYNTIIDQVAVNAELDDIATALTNSLTKNGETTATANQPMGTYRHTGVGNGVARTDYAAMGQLQDGTANWVAGGGTADAITATYAPVITTLVDGQICFVRATAANATTTPTFAPNGLTARTITLNGGQALVAGNIYGAGHGLILRYKLASTIWELLNPNVISITGNAATATTATGLTQGTQGYTLVAEQATTSGTSIDFTGIPAWATRIHIRFKSVSTSGTSPILLQIGDAGGIETSSYTGTVQSINNTGPTSGSTNYTTGFIISREVTSTTYNIGTVTLSATNLATFEWTVSGVLAIVGAVNFPNGYKLLSQALTTVRITTVGGAETFDSGAISIAYE